MGTDTDHAFDDGSPPAFTVNLNSAPHTHVTVSWRYELALGPRWDGSPGDPSIDVSAAGTTLRDFTLHYVEYAGYVPGGYGFNPTHLPDDATIEEHPDLSFNSSTGAYSVTLPHDGSSLTVDFSASNFLEYEGFLDWVKVTAVAPDVDVFGGGVISEEGGSTTFTISRSGAPNDVPLTVQLDTNDGTATPGEDYETFPSTVQFSEDQSSLTFDVVAKDDPEWEEGGETVIVGVPDGGNYLAARGDGATTQQATIQDEPPELKLTGSHDSSNGTSTVGISGSMPNPFGWDNVTLKGEYTGTFPDAGNETYDFNLDLEWDAEDSPLSGNLGISGQIVNNGDETYTIDGDLTYDVQNLKTSLNVSASMTFEGDVAAGLVINQPIDDYANLKVTFPEIEDFETFKTELSVDLLQLFD